MKVDQSRLNACESINVLTMEECFFFGAAHAYADRCGITALMRGLNHTPYAPIVVTIALLHMKIDSEIPSSFVRVICSGA